MQIVLQIEFRGMKKQLFIHIICPPQTLEGIPDVVSSCPALKQLFNSLAATEKSTQQQQQNGNFNTQNGFTNNTVNNKDLNANPQPIISPILNNKRLITNQSSETHL